MDPKDGPKRAQADPKQPQEDPRWPKMALRWLQEGPKVAPRWPEDGPKKASIHSILSESGSQPARADSRAHMVHAVRTMTVAHQDASKSSFADRPSSIIRHQ